MPNAELEVRTYGADARPRVGFFTDTSLCIGCKACEVACKEWNHVPDDIAPWTGESYDNTRSLGADTWRHVAFVEQKVPVCADGAARSLVKTAAAEGLADEANLETYQEGEGFRWLMASDVCKHCTDAACLDVCPTGALFRTEFGTVVVQADVCNGCGYCVPACPFGVLDRREGDGRVWKCTLCYDRLRDGLEPACAKACPTDSIQFGAYDELVDVARGRVLELHSRGVDRAYLYGAGDSGDEQLAGGLGAFFLLTEAPERFGLPAQAESPIQENGPHATLAGMTAAVGAASITIASFLLAYRRR